MSQNKLNELHAKLTDRYTDLLVDAEDPRLLKEIREFLSDNNVNATTIEGVVPEGSNEAVDLSEEYMGNYKLAK